MTVHDCPVHSFLLLLRKRPNSVRGIFGGKRMEPRHLARAVESHAGSCFWLNTRTHSLSKCIRLFFCSAVSQWPVIATMSCKHNIISVSSWASAGLVHKLRRRCRKETILSHCWRQAGRSGRVRSSKKEAGSDLAINGLVSM